MKYLIFVIIIPLLIAASCKYKPDLNFMSDAKANFFSEEIYVNDILCRDYKGNVGGCFVQHVDNNNIKFKIDQRPYDYRLSVICSSSIGYELNTDINKYKEYTFEINYSNFENVESFTCQIKTFPKDRDGAITLSAEVRFKVYKRTYVKLDEPVIRRDNNKIGIGVGQYSKHTTVCNLEKCEHYKERPYFKTKLTGKLKIRSESEVGRVSYLIED